MEHPVVAKIWHEHYPAGVPAQVQTERFASLVALVDEALAQYRERTAYRFMGAGLRFAEVDTAARALAAWLQGAGLLRGDRVAVMLPNVPQYAVAVLAILRAGCVVVNVNPASSARELEHQLRDSGAKAIVVLEHFAAALQAVLEQVPTRHVLLSAMGDLLGPLKGGVVNHLARRVQREVPEFCLPNAVRWRDALARGRRMKFTPPRLRADDIALLQYTGGTTGLSRGAILLHRNLVANVLQCEAWYRPALSQVPSGEQVVTVCTLPLHQVFAFTTNLLLGLHTGGCNILIPQVRDLNGLLKELAKLRFHVFAGGNALFDALLQHPDMDKVDWSHLRLSLGGGMAVQAATARAWQHRTGCAVCEGYGLSETSPIATCNPTDATAASGTVGLPLPSTDVTVLDDDGRPLPPGQMGEVAVRGPQVMAGYWQRPDETAKVMTADGFMRTGDVGVMDERGWLRIIDRKKDMILVSGFNVYPIEVEDVLSQLSGVRECAAVGVPDDRSGEVVKVVIVRQDPDLTEGDVRAYCENHLTGYKRPRHIEFRAGLPKTPVGKVLRRELR